MGCAKRRWWLFISNGFQTALVFAAFALQIIFTLEHSAPAALGFIGLLAFASGSQIAMVRGLGITEFTTATATSPYVDIVIDKRILVHFAGNIGRNRRLSFLIALISGSFVGSAVERFGGKGMALVVSGAMKATVTVLMLLVEDCEEAEERKQRTGASFNYV